MASPELLLSPQRQRQHGEDRYFDFFVMSQWCRRLTYAFHVRGESCLALTAFHGPLARSSPCDVGGSGLPAELEESELEQEKR